MFFLKQLFLSQISLDGDCHNDLTSLKAAWQIQNDLMQIQFPHFQIDADPDPFRNPDTNLKIAPTIFSFTFFYKFKHLKH